VYNNVIWARPSAQWRRRSHVQRGRQACDCDSAYITHNNNNNQLTVVVLLYFIMVLPAMRFEIDVKNMAEITCRRRSVLLFRARLL